MAIVLLFGIYFFVGIWTLGMNKPTFGKVLGKFLYLAGMFFVWGFLYLIFVDDYPRISILLSTLILSFSLWTSYKW